MKAVTKPEPDEARARELARQSAVLAACCALAPTSAPAGLHTDAAGLRAYQLNARATAQRVVLSHFPTIAAMLGEEALRQVAVRLWQLHPPGQGDLGEWGAELPALLESLDELHDWPWLADSARLDWACHQSARAADALPDLGSLHALANTDPERLNLRLQPSVQVVASRWPVVALRQAHRLPEAEQAQAASRALVEAGCTGDARHTGEAHRERELALVWRAPSWDVRVARLPEGFSAWMLALQSQPQASLAQLLDQAEPGLDFGAWLNEALAQGWIWRVAVI